MDFPFLGFLGYSTFGKVEADKQLFSQFCYSEIDYEDIFTICKMEESGANFVEFKR